MTKRSSGTSPRPAAAPDVQKTPVVVGIDIGGTFTDFVLTGPDGLLRIHKRLTTSANPADGAVDGLEAVTAEAGLELADVDRVVHGTTLVTNAIIERTGAKTALLTTRGFRDVLEMGFEQRYDIYDLFLAFPDPIVPRDLRREVDERVDRDGNVLRAPDPQAVLAEVDGLVADGVEAIAICFLHAYLQPANERAVAEAIAARWPDLALSVSHEVVPEIKEYERSSTTACNAYVQPIMRAYLGDLEARLRGRGFRGSLLLMQSSGGLASVDTAGRFPIRFLESGPAGGTLVTAYVAGALDTPEIVAFDMGGTTAKASLVRGARPETAPEMEAGRVHRFKSGSGLPIKTPVVDMIEIGAGGGSIATTDAMGLLKVGPHSAGADPGPACYGRGGLEPTVTDACVLLGYFDPAYFLGGTMRLDLDAAHAAFDRLADRLGVSSEAATWGVHRLVCENMAQAARVHLIEKGEDPRRFALMAFGGAGPAHAARVARLLGASEVLIPRMSGVASALGFQVAAPSFEITRSLPTRLRDADWEAVADLYRRLRDEAMPLITDAGLTPEQVYSERVAEMRFEGQFHELRVPLPDGHLDEALGAELVRRFVAEYERRYHAALESYEPMVLNWQLRLVGPDPSLQLEAVAPDPNVRALKGHRRVHLPEAGGWTEVPVHDRYALATGATLQGPCIVEEAESTTVVLPGDDLTVDALGNLRIVVDRATQRPGGNDRAGDTAGGPVASAAHAPAANGGKG